MPRPAPRVAPATTATRPVSGFLPATGRVRDLAASGDCLGRPAIAIPPDADHRRINRCISTGVWSARKGLRRVGREELIRQHGTKPGATCDSYLGNRHNDCGDVVRYGLSCCILPAW